LLRFVLCPSAQKSEDELYHNRALVNVCDNRLEDTMPGRWYQ